MPEQSPRWLWYERPWFVIAALVVFWPIGLALMWAQGKFSPAVRVALSVIAPALSAAVLVGVVLLPRGAAPSTDLPAPLAETTISPLPTSSVSATGSLAASSTTSSKAPTLSGKKTTARPKPKTSSGNTAPPRVNNPQPVQPVHPSGTQLFTLTGTYSGTHVSYTLSAGGVYGATEYDWFVVASGESHNPPNGQNVSFSYEGQPPTSVQLTVEGSDGSTIRQSFAPVIASKGALTATGYTSQ